MDSITVIDCETTGLDPAVDRIVEVAKVTIDVATRQILPNKHRSDVFNPDIPVPPTASAIHHLTDADVDAGFPLTMLRDLYFAEGTIYAAHNAKFDEAFLGWPIGICTKKLAYTVWPDAPRYSNQVLRYWRGIKFTDASSRAVELPPHRALHDAFVTAHLLIELLSDLDWNLEAALAISSRPSLLPTVTFGKHSGTAWKDVPKDYLRWVRGQEFDEDVLHTANFYLSQ